MAHPDPEWIETILVTFLEGNAEGLAVGDAEAPESPSPAYPYLVPTPLAPFSTEGSLNSVDEIQNIEWQVASVGLTRQQASWGRARARDRMKTVPGPDFSPASYKLTGEVKLAPGPAFSSDLADKPPLFLAFETYRMMVTPA